MFYAFLWYGVFGFSVLGGALVCCLPRIVQERWRRWSAPALLVPAVLALLWWPLPDGSVFPVDGGVWKIGLPFDVRVMLGLFAIPLPVCSFYLSGGLLVLRSYLCDPLACRFSMWVGRGGNGTHVATLRFGRHRYPVYKETLPVTIGRAPEMGNQGSALRIHGHGVEPAHAVLNIHGSSGLAIYPLGQNGTITTVGIDGLISPVGIGGHALRDGETILLGRARLVLECLGQAD